MDTINVSMLVYNILCNNYVITINVEKKEAINLLQSYIITKNNRKKYIENFFKLINWKKVEENFESALSK